MMFDFYTAACREVARVLAEARRNIDRELYPKPGRTGITYGNVTVNTAERHKARLRMFRRNPSGWKSRMRA
jgi:hypothetical protein